MNDFWGNLIGVFTVLSLIAFIGIWIWVWNRRHKAKFDALARLPMEEDDTP